MILNLPVGNTLHLLLVEDSDSDIRLMQIYLEECGPRFRLKVARTLAEALAAIGEHDFDAILLDLNLPDARGQQSIEAIKQPLAPHTAIIVITETADDDLALRILAFGAQDYLTKAELSSDSIRKSVTYAMERIRHLAEIERYKNNLETLVAERTAELDKSREQYRLLAISSPVGVFRTDADDYCIFVNPMWTNITGLSEEETIGTHWWETIHPDEKASCESEWAHFVDSRDEKIFEKEVRLLQPNGAIKWVIVRANRVDPVEDSGTVGTISDTTKTKGLVEQLKKLV